MTATDKTLGSLHTRLAEVMLESLENKDTAGVLLDEFGNDIPEPVAAFLESYSVVSPSMITAITKFLKDNEITCQPDVNDRMSDLQKRLADKRRPLSDIAHTDGSEATH